MRRVAIAVFLALALLAGCAHVEPIAASTTPTATASESIPVSPPAVAPSTPLAPTPEVQPAPPIQPMPAEPAAKPPTPQSKISAAAPSAAKAKPPAASAPVAQRPTLAPVVTTPATVPASPSLNLTSLEQRLRDTHAIGVFTKLSLKNQVDDLLDRFRAFYRGELKTPMADLRQQYELLVMKVLTVLQNGDPTLATTIASSREAIWGILADPKKFAQI